MKGKSLKPDKSNNLSPLIKPFTPRRANQWFGEENVVGFDSNKMGFFYISQEPNFRKTFKFCCNQSQVNKYQEYIQNPAKHLTMRFFAKITIFAKTSILRV